MTRKVIKLAAQKDMIASRLMNDLQLLDKNSDEYNKALSLVGAIVAQVEKQEGKPVDVERVVISIDIHADKRHEVLNIEVNVKILPEDV